MVEDEPEAPPDTVRATLADAPSTGADDAPTSGGDRAATWARAGGPSREALLELAPARYTYGQLIGRGGMGEVVAAYDTRIGRDIAIKRMRTADPGAPELARFLREAKIQARLDHPAIVPVYELALDADRRPFFAMKRLAAVTLTEVRARGASLQRMLRVVVDVCRAIDLAHHHGVVHRDLKPANIMVGHYGDVYVLDWGVAHLMTEHPTLANQGDVEAQLRLTAADELCGTPGYMAPEQIGSDPVTPAVDVYALGAILFEILCDAPLHRPGPGAIGSTLARAQIAPSERCPGRAIPPELDAACFAALAEDPAARPTARALADQLEAYLDGDRDLERRRAIAAQLIADARRAAAAADPEQRAAAVRSAGRALALDPESVEAAELVTHLLVAPPAALPSELVDDLAASHRRATRRRSRSAMRACLLPFALVPLVPTLSIASWPWLIAFYAAMAGYAALFWLSARRGVVPLAVALPAVGVLAVVWSRIAGPLVLGPVLLSATWMMFSWNPWFQARAWRGPVLAAASVLLPTALEWLGALAPTTSSAPPVLAIRSAMFAGIGASELPALIAANAVFVVGVAALATRIAAAATRAERSLHIQSWHLRQLVPSHDAAGAPRAQ